MWILGIIVMVLGVIISVALHELGHLLPAKKFRTIVPEYWVGFGPVLWKTRRGDTTYGVKAILLGGYVRIVGMFPPSVPGAKTVRRDGRLTLAEQAREQSAADISEARSQGASGVAFYELTTPKKLAVMFGGPLMNLFLSFVLVCIVLMGFGWQAPSTTIAQVVPEISGETSPAAAATLQPGDQITQWDGQEITSWGQLRGLIAKAPNQIVPIVVEREGQTLDLTIEPVANDAGDGSVGIVAAISTERGSFGQAISITADQFVATGEAIVALPVSLFNTTKSLILGEERDQSGVISIVGVARIAGQITSEGSLTIEDGSGGQVSTEPSFADRVVMLLSLLASLNMALFVFNLIPLPPLDGGHIVGALWGGVRNLWARLRGQPKPRPADTARLMPLTYGVFAVLMVMTLVLVVADLFNPVSLS